MNIEEMTKFAESIPMEDLYSEIRRMTGLSDLKFTTKIDTDRYGAPVIRFESQDLADRTGFLHLLFSSLVISQFNSRIQYDEDNNRYWYWGTASFRYSHPDGGSNGHDFLDFRYISDAWQFS